MKNQAKELNLLNDDSHNRSIHHIGLLNTSQGKDLPVGFHFARRFEILSLDSKCDLQIWTTYLVHEAVIRPHSSNRCAEA